MTLPCSASSYPSPTSRSPARARGPAGRPAVTSSRPVRPGAEILRRLDLMCLAHVFATLETRCVRMPQEVDPRAPVA